MKKKKGGLMDIMIKNLVEFLAIPGYVNCPDGDSVEPGHKDRNFGVCDDPQLLAEELRVAFRSEG